MQLELLFILIGGIDIQEEAAPEYVHIGRDTVGNSLPSVRGYLLPQPVRSRTIKEHQSQKQPRGTQYITVSVIAKVC